MSVPFETRAVVVGPILMFRPKGTAVASAAAAVPAAYVSVVAHRGEEEKEKKNRLMSLGMRRRHRVEEEESESSSIGEESSLSLSSSSSTVGAGEEEEVESKLKCDPLGSLDSLEDSLPIKRGLSSHFAGKSKSFASLSDASLALSSAKDLAKPENPFNKRRRILMACKDSWPRRASYGSLLLKKNTSSHLSSLLPPSSAVLEDVDEEETAAAAAVERGGGGGGGGGDCSSLAPLFPTLHHGGTKCRAFRSPRSFSLTDLQHA